MMKLHESLVDRPLTEVLKESGVVGCGGSGFPAWAKYETLQPLHVTNAQESEPGYYIDKWLHKAEAPAFAELYRWLLSTGVEKIIIAAKQKDREWFTELERLTEGEVIDCTGKNRCNPAEHANPILFTYTDDRYAFGKEGALLMIVAGVKLAAGERPTDKGVIVNNSQTLFNLHRFLTTGAPVTRKLVHVYGETRHVFLDAPVGTLADDLLRAAGSSLDEAEERGFALVEGGPGWFERIEAPRDFSLTRRTNSVLVIDPAHADPTGKDVLVKPNKPGYPKEEPDAHEQEPMQQLDPARVRIRLADNPALVAAAIPVTEVGAVVATGDVIATAAPGISVYAHASIGGTVQNVTGEWIEIER